MRRGCRAAVLRAFCGARIRLGVSVTAKSSKVAAEMTGSCAEYVNAAIVVLRAEDPALMAKVLRGDIPLLDAAEMVERRAELIASYRAATTDDRVALGRAVGADDLFDNVVVPAVNTPVPKV